MKQKQQFSYMGTFRMIPNKKNAGYKTIQLIQTEIKKHTATTNPQLAIGPQKWVVFGPTGLFQKVRKAAIESTALRASIKIRNVSNQIHQKTCAQSSIGSFEIEEIIKSNLKKETHLTRERGGLGFESCRWNWSRDWLELVDGGPI